MSRFQGEGDVSVLDPPGRNLELLPDQVELAAAALVHVEVHRRLELVFVLGHLPVASAVQLVAAVHDGHRAPEIHEVLRDVEVPGDDALGGAAMELLEAAGGHLAPFATIALASFCLVPYSLPPHTQTRACGM